MKNIYGTPTIELLLCDVEDVITASIEVDDNDGNWKEAWSN